jgi:glycosyltransferase involved in cell wall biosynthesis
LALRKLDPRGSKPVQVWTFAPDVPYLVGQFHEECFLYYCVDEYSQFDGFDPDRIQEKERELIKRSEVVVTTSEPLWRAKSAQRGDVLLIRHGVDYDHFATAWRSPPARPRELGDLRGPVFGFFGLIHHWVDRILIAEVAKLRPQCSFVLIGDYPADVTSLRRLPNVHLLGRRPYGDLPAYCAAFDAGLLPFMRNAMTRNVNPIKMYEYLAAGLPVVSTTIPEAEAYRGPILFADRPKEFAEACDAVLAADAPGRREAISATVKNETWESKVDYLSEQIELRLSRKPGRVMEYELDPLSARARTRAVAALP